MNPAHARIFRTTAGSTPALPYLSPSASRCFGPGTTAVCGRGTYQSLTDRRTDALDGRVAAVSAPESRLSLTAPESCRTFLAVRTVKAPQRHNDVVTDSHVSASIPHGEWRAG